MVHMNEMKSPFALVVKKNTFTKYSLKKSESKYSLEREKAIQIVSKKVDGIGGVILSTTGKISRELYESRVNDGKECSDFLNVGSMGHVSQISLGVSLHSKKQVFCFDGDGATLMHMGSLGINGVYGQENFKHIIFNNVSHDSVGGQPTICDKINFCEIAKHAGYKNSLVVDGQEQLEEKIDSFISSKGPSLLEIKVKKGARGDLGRPKKTPIENKKIFIEKLLS